MSGGRDSRRDRDAGGRARQARPRDALGRPLPYGATGVEPVSEEPLPPEQTIELARALVDEGRPFSAHEVLEARWKAGPHEERDLWQGLAQLCVALTHAARGNHVGAGRLLERGVGRLEAYAAGEGATYGLDLEAVVACARERVTALSASAGAPAGESVADGGRHACWCCGRALGETELTRLGSHPEVGVCAGCARWLYRRARAAAEKGRRSPAVTARRGLDRARHLVMRRGLQGWPVLGPVLRRLDRHLP
jgi:hypothetical protein